MRFYIDERGGCIAVRDRRLDNEEDQGLHADMDGVLAFWLGAKDDDKLGMSCWTVPDWQKEKAKALCDRLLGVDI